MPPVSGPACRRARALLPFVAALALAGCPDGVHWSAQEKANARLLVRSLAVTAEATRLAAGIDARFATPAERGAVAAALRDALVAALQVNEPVLRKAHDELPRRWRGEYVRALQELIAYYEERRMPAGRNPGERLNAFLRWYRATQPEFRWWEGGPGA
jgi:hypothetical protein